MPNGQGGTEIHQALNSKVITLLAYFPFVCIVPLLVKKDDAFALGHGKQGLVLFIAEIAVFILSIIFPWVLKVGMFVLFVFAFLGMLAVLNGRTIQLPLISRIADKISL